MTERPIIFTPENAQKIHEGAKTQTRRIVKPQPRAGLVYWMTHDQSAAIQNGPDYPDNEDDVVPCPYGKPGDRLWVREAWRPGGEYAELKTADLLDSMATRDSIYYRGEPHSESIDVWRPSIHMPRWACRTVLEITEIRVERLQEISEQDARAEGILHTECPDWHAVADYRVLWESINGTGSWAVNPWVWVISFKRLNHDSPASTDSETL